MTLNQLLNNIQYGENYTNYQIVKEGIEKNYDDESGIFYASERIKDLVNKIVLSESEEGNIGRMVAKIQAVEGKLENGRLMSEAYRKTQAIEILEECKRITRGVENVRKVDSEKLKNLSKVEATAKYFVECNLDSNAVLAESKNPLINKYIKEELGYINQVL